MLQFNYKQTAKINDKKIQETSGRLSSYISKLKNIAKSSGYRELESSIQLPHDSGLRSEVKKLAKKINPGKLKLIVLIGIGGSNLGTMAVYEALQNKVKPEMLFLDTVSSLKMKKAVSKLNKLKPQEFVIIAVSKSGTTTETIANLEALTGLLKKKKSEIEKRLIFITGKDSKLWLQAEEKGIYKLTVPETVGGRYSVFSAVGLLPLRLSGIDIDALHKGASQAILDCTSKVLSKNYSELSAILTFLHNKKGINIHNTFLFNPELESCGKWYRQLMAESIGKKKDLKGKVVRMGMTPIVSIGSTDLHSMAQLYFGGPKDKFTNIVYGKRKEDVLVPKIEGKSFNNIMDAIYGGVVAAYKKNNLPFITIEFKEISEKTLGYYLQFRMIEMMYLAQLMQVNAFNQPGVEDYKRETRKLLKK